MSAWSEHLVTSSDIPGIHPEARLAELLPAFFDWQTEQWPLLAKMRGALADVEQRSVQVGTRALAIQFNPGRTVNSTAKVDAASIEKRPCFLCPENLPPEEKGIAFGSDLVILANPFPILAAHFVVAHREHRRQEAAIALDGLVDFAHATEGALTVVYNGPKSGASAPDHLHLQAVVAGVLPEEVHAQARLSLGEVPGELLIELPQVKVWSDTSSGRWIIGLVGTREAVSTAARAAIEALRVGQPHPDLYEPPLNLVATAGRPGEVVVLLFPRAAHRPGCYFAEDPHRRVVSPGAIDMAGVIVTVRHEDYLRLRPEDIAQIFTEVSRPADPALIQSELRRRLADGPV